MLLLLMCLLLLLLFVFCFKNSILSKQSIIYNIYPYSKSEFRLAGGMLKHHRYNIDLLLRLNSRTDFIAERNLLFGILKIENKQFRCVRMDYREYRQYLILNE